MNITIPYSEDDNTNKAFSISQAMTDAQEFANKFANMPLNKLHLNVAFPGQLHLFIGMDFLQSIKMIGIIGNNHS